MTTRKSKPADVDGDSVVVTKSTSTTLDMPAANAMSNDANQRALRAVNVRIIDVSKQKAGQEQSQSQYAAPGASNVLPEDPFAGLITQGKAIEPPFDMLTLSMLAEHNGELGQCIEAMEVNIEATGHRLVSRLKMDAKGDPDVAGSEALKKAAEAERVRLVNFFMYATEESFISFRRRIRKDLESTGNAYVEVVRDLEGNVQNFNHIPSYQMRLGILDDEEHLVDRPIVELQVDGSVVAKNRKEWRRFRPYVQSRAVLRGNLRLSAGGCKLRYFKSWLDPRPMDRDTGESMAQTGSDSKGNPIYEPLPQGKRPASEIIHLKLYSTRTPYGLPRYIGNLLSIYGDRAAEEINYITFRNNNIPSMFICVSNGQLTQASIDRITGFSESTIQGSDNMSKFIILEGEPFETEMGEDGGQVKIETKSLTKDQRTDELFTNYRERNADRVRRSFRLPPVFVGISADYSYATIQASRSLGDEQVFAPERTTVDDMMNRDVFPAMGVVYHTYKSNTPNTTDNTALVKIVAAAEKTGGMTPRIARQALEEILGNDLPPFPDGFPADLPFSLTMAAAVKNQADASEPGQQVTALKAMGVLNDDLSLVINDDDDNESIAKKLTKLQNAVETMWHKQQMS